MNPEIDHDDVMALIDTWSRSDVNPFDVRVHSHELDLEAHVAFQKASDYLSDGERGSLRSICLNGERGSGKTAMLYMLKRRAQDSGRPVAFIDLSDPVFRSGGDRLDLCMYFYANLLKTFCESIQSTPGVDSDRLIQVQEFEELLRTVLLGDTSLANEKDLSLIKKDPSLSFLFNWSCNRLLQKESTFKAMFIDLIEEGLKQFLEYRAAGTKPVLIINGLHHAVGTGIPLILDRLNSRPSSPKPWSSCRIQFVCAMQDGFVAEYFDNTQDDQEILHSFYKTHVQIDMPALRIPRSGRLLPQVPLLIRESLTHCNTSQSLNFSNETVSLALRTILGSGIIEFREMSERNSLLNKRWGGGTRDILIFELSIFFDLYRRGYERSCSHREDPTASLSGTLDWDEFQGLLPDFFDLSYDFTQRSAEHLVVRGKDPIDVYFSRNSKNAEAAVYLVCSILHPRIDEWLPMGYAKDLFESAASSLATGKMSRAFAGVSFEELVLDLLKHRLLSVKRLSDDSAKISKSDMKDRPEDLVLKSNWDSQSTAQITASTLINRVNNKTGNFQVDPSRFQVKPARIDDVDEEVTCSTNPISDCIQGLSLKLTSHLEACGAQVSGQLPRRLMRADAELSRSFLRDSESFLLLKKLASTSPETLSFLLEKPVLLVEIKLRDDCRWHLSDHDRNLAAKSNLFFAYTFDAPSRIAPMLIDDIRVKFSGEELTNEIKSEFKLIDSFHSECLYSQSPGHLSELRLISKTFAHSVFRKDSFFSSVKPQRFSKLLGDLQPDLVDEIVAKGILPLAFLSILSNKDGHNHLAYQFASIPLKELQEISIAGSTPSLDLSIRSFLAAYNFLVSCLISNTDPLPLFQNHNFELLQLMQNLLDDVCQDLNDPQGRTGFSMLVPPSPSLEDSTCSTTEISNGVALKSFIVEHASRLHPSLQDLT